MDTVKLKSLNFFNSNNTAIWECLKDVDYPWQVLDSLSEIVLKIGKGLDKEKYDSPEEGVWIAKNSNVSEFVTIQPPCIIGENTIVRTGALIRGSVIIGDNCVIGNSVEVKNSVIFDEVKLAHYNYVGDSIIGYNSHLGAGAITSNVRLDKEKILIKAEDDVIKTDLKKIGAIIGENVEIGCNAVLNPGTVVGSNSVIYPLTSVKGVIDCNSIVRNNVDVVVIAKN